MTRRTLLATAALAQAQTNKEIRIGILGAGARGIDCLRITLTQPNIRVAAVCDINEASATRAQQLVETATSRRPTPYTRGSEDYKRMLDSPEIDAVLIMTPQTQHAAQAVYAMNAGKHVGSETPAAYSVDECWALVEAKEKTGRSYMLLENYPWSRTRMMILNMAHTGAFGELTYGEGSYIHDTRALAYEAGGKLSWRGDVARNNRGDVYPTHGLGPVSLWMGINRNDRYTTLVSMDTGNKGLTSYATERWGKDHPAAKPGFFQKGDTTITLLRSANEKMVALRYESASTRPAGRCETLNGTKGAYDGNAAAELVYLQGKSPNERWEPITNYRAAYEHPYWKKDGELAASTGHGGGDYFVLREFYRSVLEDREPPIDIYDAVTWSAVLPLSSQSIRSGNKSIELPDFTRGKWKGRKFTGFGIGTA
ncbi:MAG TPA: Gfo/Idh/MocA family oxidoreductase [Bryobacteraceae bacterium]|jgi:predicted dehydrogenase|nr:Gfo/Idh/MocA family oxidoreductase [Bryobacteraceae bacterium]